VLIVDTSAIVPFVLADEADDRIPTVIEAVRDGNCVAPGLWSWEIANSLWKALRSGRLNENQLDTAIQVIESFGVSIETTATEKALGPTLALAIRYGLTAYDAAYLELSMRLGAELATHDADLRKAALAEGITIHPAP
jgi:predicted nucleic acid-binding protein